MSYDQKRVVDGCRMLPSAIAGIVEHRRWIGATEWSVIAHIGPKSAGIGLALGQDRNRRIDVVQT